MKYNNIFEEIVGDDLPIDIDFVFPYVNNADPNWLKLHAVVCKREGREVDFNGARYKDFGTLQFLFRCINKNMPWIRKIFIIVEQESQVPKWLNTDTVKVIYHRDIIPESLLPTYNSNTIEMFIDKIEGLSEYFIYGNDDVFPTLPLKKSDFYNKDFYPRLKAKKNTFNDSDNKMNMYHHMIKSSNLLALKYFDLVDEDPMSIIRLNHSLNPMLKSTGLRLHSKFYDDIIKACSPFRKECNYSQELYSSWQYYANKYSNKYNIKTKYIGLEKIDSSNGLLDDLNKFLIICLNDSLFDGRDDNKCLEIEKAVLEAFTNYLPDRCLYENDQS